MAEAAFSEDGKYYSAVSADGRLRIWDTETSVLKQEYTPDLHLSSPTSCLQWITVTQSIGQAQQQGKRNSVSETELQCIALGSVNGKILLYSVAQAKVQSILQKGSSKVTALDWHKKYGLFSCGKNRLVIEWDLHSGSARNSYNVDYKGKQENLISAIKIVPHNLDTNAHYLVTASWQVRLWRLHGGEATVIKTLGHNASQTAVLSVATLKDNCWLIEGSQNERLLSFWDVTITEEHKPQVNGEDITPNKKKRKKSLSDAPIITNASYNFVLEDAPRIVDVDLKEEEGAMRLSLAAATRSGVVHYYGHMLNGSSIKPLKPSVTVQATTPEAEPLPLQCCRLKRSGELLLGYSNGPVMTFETVTPDVRTKTQVLIRGETKQQQTKQKKDKLLNNDANKVRSDPNSAAAQLVEPLGGVATRKRVAPGAQVEVPMEARLANLSIDVRASGAVNQNFTKLLVQGLHSKDQGILRLVLERNSGAVAARTVARLPPDCVPLLLEQLLNMAALKTSLCACVCKWVNAVLRRHAALLLALQAAPQHHHLTKLLAVFTQRRSHLCQLLNLKGRVELTLAQRAALGDTTTQDDEKAILEYNDDTSSDEEDTKVEKQYKSDSEMSWGDNKNDSDAADDDDDEMEQNGDDDGSGSDDDNEE